MNDVALLAGSLAAGIVTAALLVVALRDVFGHEVFARTNFAGRPVSTGVGVVVALTVLTVAAVVAVVQEVTDDVSGTYIGALIIVVIVTVGFGLLGLLDDLAGVGESGGFRGHLHAAVQGRLTTGGLKLLGGGVLGVLVSAGASDELLRVVADGALVALAANLANLLDRRPGRTAKASVMVFAALVAGLGADAGLAAVGVAVGAVLGILRWELAEEVMLGDAGSNAVGAALGVGIVYTVGPDVRSVVLVVLVLANLASERWSFSDVIDAAPPLRFLDGLGRRRD